MPELTAVNLPPKDAEVEARVITDLLSDREKATKILITDMSITPEHFYLTKNVQTIKKIIKYLTYGSADDWFKLSIVVAAAKDDRASDMDYERLTQLAARREFIMLCTAGIEGVYDEPESVKVLVKDLINRLQELKDKV